MKAQYPASCETCIYRRWSKIHRAYQCAATSDHRFWWNCSLKESKPSTKGKKPRPVKHRKGTDR